MSFQTVNTSSEKSALNLYVGTGVFGTEKVDSASSTLSPKTSSIQNYLAAVKVMIAGDGACDSWLRQRDLCLTMLCSEVSLHGRMGLWIQKTNQSDVGIQEAQAPLSNDGSDCHRWENAERTMLTHYICEMCLLYTWNMST